MGETLEELDFACRTLTARFAQVVWVPGNHELWTLSLAPLFLLYDYSFRPDDVSEQGALPWAMDANVLCTDEAVLHPDPYPSRAAWCAARVEHTRARLEALPPDCATVPINHFPLRYEHVRLPRIPSSGSGAETS